MAMVERQWELPPSSFDLRSMTFVGVVLIDRPSHERWQNRISYAPPFMGGARGTGIDGVALEHEVRRHDATGS
jgi:hypothetical protein